MWTEDDVGIWLATQVKLPKYVSLFSKQEIDGGKLDSLTNSSLQ
jgi:hypothetical protein